jgi:hypothetical protein
MIMPPSFWLVLALAGSASAQVPYNALLEDFESASPGSAPVATTLIPSSPVGATTALPIPANSIGPRGVVAGPYSNAPNLPLPGTGQFTRIYDYDTDSSTGLEFDFVADDTANVTAVRVSFAFAATANLGAASKPLRFSVTSHGLSVGSAGNRPFLLTLANDGTGKLDFSGTGSDITANFNLATAHYLVLYANDHDSETLAITGPDGIARTIATNSAAIFLDNVYRGAGPFDATSNYRILPSNLGHCGFTTVTSESSIDFTIDDLQVEVLRDRIADSEPTLPVAFGSGVADYSSATFDPEVLLWDRFPYGNEELRFGSSARWTVRDGAPTLRVENDSLVFDHTGATANVGHYTRPFSGGRLLVRDVTTSSQIGPVLYRSFDLTVDTPPAASATGWFAAIQGVASATTLNGFVWLRPGTVANTYQIGLSTDTAPPSGTTNAAFASTNLQPGVTYRIVVRFDSTTNDSVLWINPVNESVTPAVSVAKTGDRGTYQFTGLALRIGNTINLGRFHLDDLRAATTFAAAYATTPIVQPVAELRRSGSNISILTDSFDAYVSGPTQISFLRHAGLFWLASEGGAWTVAGSATGVNASLVGSFFYKTYTLREIVGGGADAGRFTFLLQNNGTTTATYRLALSPAVAQQARPGDGGLSATPVVATGSAAADVVFRHSSGAVLRLTGFSRLAAVGGKQYLFLDIPSRTVRTFSLTFEALAIDAPQDWQVFQRSQRTGGGVITSGRAPMGTQSVTVEFAHGDLRAPPLAGALPVGEQPLPLDPITLKFSRNFSLPAGGWYQAVIRARNAIGDVLAERIVARFGVGEVFLASGQSNSTNSANANSDAINAVRLNSPVTRLFSAFSGANWQEGKDPQPGAHDASSDGSYYPQFGDRMAARFRVPIAASITGQGSTEVAEFLPDAPHNFTAIDQAYRNGLYGWLRSRLLTYGPGGFRGLLWHQGESDSTHTDGVTRTTQQDYYLRLKSVIQNSRADAGWPFPWFVARASWWPPVIQTNGTPDGTAAGDPNIQAAQEQLWAENIAEPGADTDTLGLDFRDRGGSRVHFASPLGSDAHAALWTERVGDYIDAIFDGLGALDSDGGGAPDYWERLFGYNPASAADDTADTDADGLTNAAEFVIGGDPHAPSLPFLARVEARPSGELRIHYRAHAGRVYVLEQRAALDQGEWTTLYEVVAPTEDPDAVFTVQPGGASRGFFRVRAKVQ